MSIIIKTSALIVLCLFFSCQDKKSGNQKANSPLSKIENYNIAIHNNNQKLLDSIIDSDNVSIQQFEVLPNTATWVTAKKGLKVYVDYKKLTKNNGEAVNGKIIVNIKEVTNVEDMIAANTPTQSDGKMLESGGSYYIKMENNGEELSIKKGKTLQIQLPNFQKNGMKLFYGEKLNNGFVNWKPTTTNFEVGQFKSKILSRDYYFEKFKVGDSIGKRPCSLVECIKKYKDSVYSSRWKYTIANRDKLSWKQEMQYGLRPIEFPYDTFRKYIVRNNMNYSFDHWKNAYSKMFTLQDTFPVYKERKSFYNYENNEQEEKLKYYEPIEIETLGWINCDRFNDVPLCMNTTINLGKMMNLNLCRVYFSFKKMNSVLAEQFNFNVKEIERFNINTKLPIGEKVDVNIVAIVDGKVIKNKKSFVVENNNNWKLELEQNKKT